MGLSDFYNWIDDKFGPDKTKYTQKCSEGKEMLVECVKLSECYKNNKNFQFCLQEDIDKECKSLRYDYFRCRRTALYWEKSLRDDPR